MMRIAIALTALLVLAGIGYTAQGPGIPTSLWEGAPGTHAHTHEHEGSDARHLRSTDVSRLKHGDRVLRVCDNSYLNSHARGRAKVNGKWIRTEDRNGARDGCGGRRTGGNAGRHDVCPGRFFDGRLADCSADSLH